MLETDAMIGPGICRCFAQLWNSRRTKSPNPKKRAILGDTLETASIMSNYTGLGDVFLAKGIDVRRREQLR